MYLFSIFQLLFLHRQYRTPEQLTDALLKECATCDADELESLIEKGADVNGSGHPSGDRPLRIAAVNGHLECVKKLLELGANPTLTFQNGKLLVRPLVSVQAATILLKEAKRNPNLLVANDKNVSMETYEEIIKVLEDAERNPERTD